jgi:anti-sigma-K factor RskA
MTHNEDAHLLSGAYALHAVTPEEAALVERAMAESEDLRSEVVGLADTAVTLGLSLPTAAPPADLRARLLDAIDDLPQESPDAPEAPAADERPAEPEATVAAPVAMPAGAHQVPPRRRRRRPMVLLVTVAAAVAIFAGGSFVTRSLFEVQTEYTNIQTAADVQTAQAPIDGGGTVKVSWSASEHRTAVQLNGVTVPEGKVLQLWSVRGDTITSAGLYEPQQGQNYTLISGTPNAGEALAVSVEPDGGSAQPTTDPIVAVPLRA